jgi:hypothetical protein
MARFAYRKASRWWGLWITVMLAGVLGLILTVFLLISTGLDRRLGFWTAVIAMVPLFLAIVTGLTVMAKLNRRRIERVAARLRELGFHVVEKPANPERANFAAPIGHLLPTLGLKTGATGITWFAVAQTGASKALLFEHAFTTGSGRASAEHHHTVKAWPAGHPDLRDVGLANAPWFFMGRFSRFTRRISRKRELVSPEFNDVAHAWSLLGDATTATRFLTPVVRRALDLSPKNEAWSVGAGWVCCAFKGTFDAANLDPFLSHTRSVLASDRRDENTGGPGPASHELRRSHHP